MSAGTWPGGLVQKGAVISGHPGLDRHPPHGRVVFPMVIFDSQHRYIFEVELHSQLATEVEAGRFELSPDQVAYWGQRGRLALLDAHGGDVECAIN